MAKLLILLLVLIAAASLSARTLTSSDGAKSIDAQVIDYNPTSGKVVIRNEGSVMNVTVDAKAFSEEDQLYFTQVLNEMTKRKALRISADNHTERLEKTGGGLYTYDRRKESFTLKVFNSGLADVEDLVAKFDIYVTRYNREGKKTLEVVSGEHPISGIPNGSAEEFASPSVQITVGCATSSSCPKCQKHADSVETERVLGVHVRLFDGKGDLLTEFHSSGMVKTAVEKKARESSAKASDQSKASVKN